MGIWATVPVATTIEPSNAPSSFAISAGSSITTWESPSLSLRMRKARFAPTLRTV
ncbi:MAG: hypothetical protein LBD75_07680 [Candidatus Peribacteria bacterium]|nr:hypothetical protein [Candidatus Peribacteria bacterium]